jgi:hypothetical protein
MAIAGLPVTAAAEEPPEATPFPHFHVDTADDSIWGHEWLPSGAGWGGVHDLEPGTSGFAAQYEAEGDDHWFAATWVSWNVRNPHITMSAHQDRLNGHEWPAGATVTLTTDRAGLPPHDAEADPWGDFHLELQGIWELEPGDTITATHDPGDGAPIQTTHTASTLTITVVDVANSTISGIADHDHPTNLGHVEVAVDHPGHAWRVVPVEPDGSWTADFAAEPGEGMGDGVVTLVPGSHGNAHQRDGRGNATWDEWRVANPHFNVDPVDDGLWGHEWPPDSQLTVTVDDPPFGATVDVNEWGDFWAWDTGFDFQAGQTVTVAHDPGGDAEIVKTHVVTELRDVVADPETDTVSGKAAPHSWVWVGVWGPDSAGRSLQADEHGDWTADFSDGGPGEPVVDITPGTEGAADQRDEDDDATFVGWRVANPHLNVTPRHQHVDGHEWPPDAAPQVTSSDPDDQAQTAATDGDGHFWLDLWAVWTITPGEAITVTYGDDEIVRTHTVSTLQVDPVEAGTSVVSGVADHDHPTNDGRVWVEVHGEHDHVWRVVDVHPDGTWEADFSAPPGDHAGDGMISEFAPGAHGNAHQHDDQGNAIWDDWRVAAPHFNVGREHGSLWGHEWTPGATLTITVDGTAFEATVGVFDDWHDHWGPGDFELQEAGLDLQPGDVVRVTSDDAPPMVKVLTVTALVVTEVDVAADTVSGTTDSPEGRIVEVVVEQPEWRMRHVEADDEGHFVADFSEPVDDHGEGWGDVVDLGPAAFGNAVERDEDGDGTFADWRVDRPVIRVAPHESSIWGHEWPTEVTIGMAPVYHHQTSVTANEWGDFDLRIAPEEHDLGPGDLVAVTDGVTTKTLVVSTIAVTEVDIDTDTVTGTAEPDDPVLVVVQEQDAGWIRGREIVADADGMWLADFSQPAQSHPYQDPGWFEGYDPVLDTSIEAIDEDTDGDMTIVWAQASLAVDDVPITEHETLARSTCWPTTGCPRTTTRSRSRTGPTASTAPSSATATSAPTPPTPATSARTPSATPSRRSPPGAPTSGR